MRALYLHGLLGLVARLAVGVPCGIAADNLPPFCMARRHTLSWRPPFCLYNMWTGHQCMVAYGIGRMEATAPCIATCFRGPGSQSSQGLEDDKLADMGASAMHQLCFVAAATLYGRHQLQQRSVSGISRSNNIPAVGGGVRAQCSHPQTCVWRSEGSLLVHHRPLWISWLAG